MRRGNSSPKSSGTAHGANITRRVTGSMRSPINGVNVYRRMSPITGVVPTTTRSASNRYCRPSSSEKLTEWDSSSPTKAQAIEQVQGAARRGQRLRAYPRSGLQRPRGQSSSVARLRRGRLPVQMPSNFAHAAGCCNQTRDGRRRLPGFAWPWIRMLRSMRSPEAWCHCRAKRRPAIRRRARSNGPSSPQPQENCRWAGCGAPPPLQRRIRAAPARP
jgi:hypothetical protein